MCEDVGPYFPESRTCACLNTPNGEDGFGFGCSTWGFDFNWCFVGPGCEDETNESWALPDLIWSKEVCEG